LARSSIAIPVELEWKRAEQRLTGLYDYIADDGSIEAHRAAAAISGNTIQMSGFVDG
jgi:hypothetical protein